MKKMIHQARGTGEVVLSDDYQALWARARCSPGGYYDYRSACWPSARRIQGRPCAGYDRNLPFIYRVANNRVPVPKP
jgi:hypothetical protein